MVEHREKRCSNASSRGIESDRSIIRFTRAYPVRAEGGTRPSASPSSARRPVQTATSQVLRKECLADPHGIRATGVERRPRPRTRASTAGNCSAVLFYGVSNGIVEPASSRSRRNASRRHVATNPSPPWPAGGSPTERLDRERRRSGGGTERSSLPCWLDQQPGRERQRTNKDLVRWDAGARRARRIHHGSNPAVEGPRRGPKPREDRPEGRWKRRSLVRTHLRSNASKVMHHAVPTRASTPATVATSRSRLRGKRTSRRQRSWRHDTAAGGGNSPKGMNRAARTRLSRDRLHTDHPQGWPVWGVGTTRMTRETQRTPGSAAGCNKPASPASAMTQSPARAGRSAEETGGTVQNGEVGTGSRGWHLVTEATAAMSTREWTPGKRSMEGREGPVRRASLRQQCRRR
jgi:hypothetical protein